MYGMFTYFTIKFNTSIWWLIHPSRPKQHLFARPRRALPLHPHVGPREVFLVKSWLSKIHSDTDITPELAHEVVKSDMKES